jgi:type I restriction enzyme, S subunit
MTLDIKNGFKKTKIGIIPNEWNLQNIIDVSDKNDHYSFTGGPFGSDLKSEHYTEKGIRIIQLQNIGDGIFHDKYKVFTSIEKADELSSCNIFPDDIIIAKMAEPLARACIIPNNEEKRYLMCSDGIRLKVNDSEYNSKYVFFYINSDLFRKQAEAKGTGTTRLRIGLGTLKTCKIILPPLPEQKKIAEILTSIDNTIEFTRKVIDQTKKVKQGLLQELLTKGIGHTKFKMTEIGKIPDEWEVMMIEQMIRNGYILGHLDGNHGSLYPRAEEFSESGIPYISANNFIQGFVEFKNCKHLPLERALQFKKGVARDGDVLFAHNATVGPVAILETTEEFVILSTTATYYRCDKNLLINTFWKYFMQSSLFVNQYQAVMGQSTRNQVPITTQRKFFGVIPKIDEQEQIANIISTVDNKISASESEYNQLQQLKKGLMQDLLTGTVRVKV